MKIKKYFSKNKVLIGSLIFLIVYSVALISFANPPGSPYEPGVTLDPSCIPGSSNCTVKVLPSQTGNSGKYLTTNGTTTSWASVSGSVPAGSNTYLQYNDSGSFGGDSNFTWDKTTQTLNVTSPTTAFLNINGAAASFTYSGATFLVSSATGSGGDRFFIDGSSNLYQLGDISGGNNNSLLTIDDNAQNISLTTFDGSSVAGLLIDGTGVTATVEAGCAPGHCPTNPSTVIVGGSTVTANPAGVEALNLNHSGSNYKIGDITSSNNHTYLEIDDANQIVTVWSGGEPILDLEAASNGWYAIGDTWGNFNGGNFVIDDVSRIASLTNNSRNLNFGVDTSSPSFPLDVGGIINTSTQYNVAGSFFATENGSSVFIGSGVNTSATSSTLIGINAGANNTATENTFIGYNAGNANTSSTNNVYIGSQAGQLNNNVSNTFVGRFAGAAATNTTQSTIVGTAAGGALTTGNQNTALGYHAGAQETTSGTGSFNVALGSYSGRNSGGSSNILLGWAAGYPSLTTGDSNILIGNQAGGSSNNASSNILIGNSTNANGLLNTIGIGTGATPTAANQFVVGSSTTAYTDYYFGSGVTGSSPSAFTLNASGGSGTNIGGASLSIAGGKATGNATGGSILFKTSDAGSSGSTLQSLTTKATILPSGNFGIGVTNPGSKLQINTGSDSTTGLFINGTSGQTANLLNIGKADNPAYFQIDSAGKIVAINGNSATISATNNIIYFPGGTIVVDQLQGSGAADNYLKDNNALGVLYKSNASADGAQIAHTFNTVNTLISGNKLLSIQNNSVEKAFIAYDGGAYFAGNLGILDTTPAAALTVGNGDLFKVNSSGVITSAAGITSSGTITLSTFSTNGGLIYSNGSGVLAQSGAGSSTTILHGGTTPSYSAVSLTADITGTLPVANGGTNITSYTTGDILYASASGVLSKLAGVATGNALISGGVGTAPSWGKIGLTTHISGTLGVGNGGTGTATTFTSGSVLFAGSSGIYTQDNASIFFDDTNNRLGILDATPTASLTVGSGDLFQVLSTGLVRAPDGTVNGPAYSFTGDTDTGLYRVTSSILGITVDGAKDFEFGSGYVNLPYSGGPTELRFTDGTGVSSRYVGFKAENALPSALALVWTLPSYDGAAGYALTTNGAGNLGWNPITANSVGASGDIQFSDGSYGLNGSSNLHWNDGAATFTVGDTSDPSLKIDITNQVYRLGTNSMGSQSMLFIDGVTTNNNSAAGFGYFANSANNFELGINKTFPEWALDVENSQKTGYVASLSNTNDDPSAAGLLIKAGKNGGSGDMIVFQSPNGTVAGSITMASGNSIAYNTSSDQRLKENIVDTSLTLADLMNIHIRDYSYIADTNHQTVHGVIAQELESVYPYAVTAPIDDNHYYMVDYSRLTPLIIKAIQDIDHKLEPLTSLDLNTPGSLANLIKQFIENATNNVTRIFTKTIQVQNGVEIKDKATGQIYCLTIVNGTTTTVLGNCDDNPINNNPDPTSTTTGGTGDTPSDTTPPVITLTGDASITLQVGDTYAELGATAIDDTDGDITANIQITNNIDTNTPGTYTVRYTVEDSSLNHTEITREVVVG